MSKIIALGTANPKHRFKQSQLADFMVKAMQLNEQESRKLRKIFSASGIEYRHSVLQDYGLSNGFSFYPNTEDFEPFPSTAKRLSFFRDHALQLSLDAVGNMMKKVPTINLRDVTHLIVVSCTGFYAPGLDIELVNALHLQTTVQRTAINFMGCYAAFNALKVADAFCARDVHAKVLIVCTELCSLHFQKQPTEDNLISNAIFSDGAAAVFMTHETAPLSGLVPEIFCSDLLLKGASDMAWGIGDLGFEMKLSTYVPEIIKHGIGAFANTLLGKLNRKISDIKYFAVHPGGRKILENIEQELGITHLQNESAYRVLQNYGNMSSPTILFVIHDIMENISANDHDERLLSVAFGPGLTLESMVLKIDIR